jgi:hypothetical protein
VGTVSVGGCVERKSKVKPPSEAKTAKLARSIKINSVNRVRRQLCGGEWLDGEEMKEKESPLAR